MKLLILALSVLVWMLIPLQVAFTSNEVYPQFFHYSSTKYDNNFRNWDEQYFINPNNRVVYIEMGKLNLNTINIVYKYQPRKISKSVNGFYLAVLDEYIFEIEILF